MPLHWHLPHRDAGWRRAEEDAVVVGAVKETVTVRAEIVAKWLLFVSHTLDGGRLIPIP